MGRFVTGVLIGVAVVVGGYLAYKATRQEKAGPGAADATQPAAVAPHEESPAAGGNPALAMPAETRSAPLPGVTAAGLLAEARAAPSETARLAAYDGLVRQFPAAPEAQAAQAEALALRETLARTYRAAGDTYRLRNVLSDMLWKGLSEAREAELKREIVRLNETLIFSRQASPDGEIYTIKARDALEKIARTYKVTPAFLGKVNGLRDLARIRFGDTLKVVDGPFDLLVELSKYRLTVFLKGRFVKEYLVGIGKDGTTPLGVQTVTDKLTNPTWYGPDGEVLSADDPKNPLGERWIGITGGRGYGIHGTIEPESIGTACSRGCIRMLEADVEEVYDLVVPQQSRVTIVQ